MDETKKEKPPTDPDTVKTAKEFVDKKLKDEEKAVTWALQSTDITVLKGSNLTGQLIIHFNAIIRECPSETQKKMSKMLKFAVKDPMDNCKPNVINMKAEHPCSLLYSKYTGNSNLNCNMIRGK
ncbi:hypothetical protein TTRE_0000691501 [Trichuris trichiura]|uniref:Uncharacterized protein n=1 Tax=Trichuris trichiura TaxID=36087 RepID=A0A077ZDZ1_TRITR|nr:hypothetical protein TTRE_0000691501 [Trichuris trichiura]